jgi:ADP-ribose pyrophosphatase YjhB (NUDIX family)
MPTYELSEAIEVLRRALPPPGLVIHEARSFTFDPGSFGDDQETAAEALVRAVLEAAEKAGFDVNTERLVHQKKGEPMSGRRFIKRTGWESIVYLEPNVTCGIVLAPTQHARLVLKQPAPALEYWAPEGRFVGGVQGDRREAAAVVAECIEQALRALASPK